MPGIVLQSSQLVASLAARVSGTLHAGAYINAVTPTPDTTLTDLVEADWVPYDRRTLNPSDWSAVEYGGASVGAVVYLTFTIEWQIGIDTQPPGPTYAYGWFVLDDSGALVWAESFPAPIQMATNGDTVAINVSLTERSP